MNNLALFFVVFCGTRMDIYKQQKVHERKHGFGCTQNFVAKRHLSHTVCFFYFIFNFSNMIQSYGCKTLDAMAYYVSPVINGLKSN